MHPDDVKPQYEEPWRVESTHTAYDGIKYNNCVLTVKNNYMDAILRRRFVACVNFLAGVPDKRLEEYAKGRSLYPQIITMFLEFLRTEEPVILHLLKDELEAMLDSNKAYVSRDAMEKKLLEIASKCLLKVDRGDIYKFLGIQCGKCDGVGLHPMLNYRQLDTMCDNCKGTGKAPKIPIPDEPEVETTTQGNVTIPGGDPDLDEET